MARNPNPTMRYYAEYWNDTPIINLRGWRVFDRTITYGRGDPMPVCQCWTRHAAFTIRDLLNDLEERKRGELGKV